MTAERTRLELPQFSAGSVEHLQKQSSTHGNARRGQACMDVNSLSSYSTRDREGGGRGDWEGRNAENKKINIAEEQTHANGVEKRLLKALLAFTYLSCPGQLSGNGRKPNQAGPCKRSLPQPF